MEASGAAFLMPPGAIFRGKFQHFAKILRLFLVLQNIGRDSDPSLRTANPNVDIRFDVLRVPQCPRHEFR
jgi:hypothetical protein